jgi:hypothetical protein
MRVAPIALVLMLACSDHARAQTPTSPKAFTVNAFVLFLPVSPNDTGVGSVPPTPRLEMWVGIKNETWRSFTLCTTSTGFSYQTSGGGSAHNCGANWIVLPGETHFERVTEMSLDDAGSRITATVSVRGKSLASTGPPVTWELRWGGTVADALALGDWMAGLP